MNLEIGVMKRCPSLTNLHFYTFNLCSSPPTNGNYRDKVIKI